MSLQCLILVTLLLYCLSALADGQSAYGLGESQSVLGLGKVLKDKIFEEDERITDLELRSYAGSLARYSVQANLGYYGPPINNLSNPNKPNPDERPGDNRTHISGTVGIRYRTTSDTAFNLNAGIRWYTPYQTLSGQPVDRPAGRKGYDVSDPSLSFDVTSAAGQAQLRSQVRAGVTTTAAYTGAGQVGSTGFSQFVKWTPRQISRVILGTQVGFDYFFFSRAYRSTDRNVSRYYINVVPSFEYKIMHSLNFNSSLWYPYQNLRSASSWWHLQHQLSSWRVGLGWAITRDIYVNPHVNFFAEALALNTASLSVSTIFSVF